MLNQALEQTSSSMATLKLKINKEMMILEKNNFQSVYLHCTVKRCELTSFQRSGGNDLKIKFLNTIGRPSLQVAHFLARKTYFKAKQDFVIFNLKQAGYFP